jgi:hypothetical protein
LGQIISPSPVLHTGGGLFFSNSLPSDVSAIESLITTDSAKVGSMIVSGMSSDNIKAILISPPQHLISLRKSSLANFASKYLSS